MRKGTRRQFDWSGSVEQLEERVVMSADPLADLLGGAIEHHAIVDDMPPLSQHQVVDDLPPLAQHDNSLPAIENHQQPEADFWIDYDNLGSLESDLERIEQSLSDAHDQSGLTQVRDDYGFDGTGQTVAIIDSGIAYDHFALGGGLGSNYRVVGGWDFTGENDADPYDDGPSGSHGTHVAGIVGASGGTHDGVAPGVDLVGLRVFDDAGNGYFSWVEDALQWIYDNRDTYENPITAVNLSLGVASWNSDSIPSWANLEDEFSQLNQVGIFVSVSAGNSFTSFNTTGLSYPAASEYVVPVASVDDTGLLSYYSQRNSRVIAAPGRGIYSTVPDYKGNNDGTVNDYASYSGTSMAAPYVAGASVIIREAMEFAGYTNITQDTIYDHMVATADSFYDSATDAYYNRLNLDTAIDALMPTDDFGSTVGSAFDLGTFSSDASMSGSITTLDDVDYFKFTASSTGSVSFTVSNLTHSLAADWEVSGGTGVWSGTNNETFTIDVVAGQEYTVGFSSQDGLGYYDLEIAAEGSAFTFTDWGAVDFSETQGFTNTGDTWYRVEAVNAGYFTAQAFFDAGDSQIDLELYNSSMELIGSGSTSDSVTRVNGFTQAGAELFLKVSGSNSDIDFRLTNLVAISGNTVTVTGTSGDDTFEFESGSTHDLVINGTNYSFFASSVTEFQFDGGSGSDSISVMGSSEDETAFMRVGTLEFSSSTLSLDAESVEAISIDGNGGEDRVYAFDSAGDDIFDADETSIRMYGDGFDNSAVDFDLTYSYSTTGGTDRAYLRDSAGDDSYVARPNYSRLSGAGFYNYTQGFELVYAFSTEGGDDTASLYDSEHNDSLVATPLYARISGEGFYKYTQAFEEVNIYATEGGYDTAAMYDSAGDDFFTARPEYGRMSGNGFNNYASGFDRVDAYATAGGTDLAYMYDSTGNDYFTARPEYGRLNGTGFFNQANNFDRVNAYAFNGGTDLAYLYDSDGDDDFVARPDYGRLSGDGFSNYAKAFDRVNAYSFGAGNDTATFYDSAGDEDYVAQPDYGRIIGADFNHYAKDFESVYAYSTEGGNDTATLYASNSGSDELTTDGDSATMWGDDYYNFVGDFETISTLASDGSPMVDTNAVDSVFEEAGA